MDETKSGMGGWMPVLFVILVVWLIFGGGLNGCGNGGLWGRNNGCCGASPCEVEKQGIIDSAQTRYLIEQQAATTRATTQAGFDAVMAQNSRIYEQGLQETIFDLKMENQSLKNNAFVKEQTDALAKQYSDCCCELNRRLDSIECRMLTKPQLSGVAATCNGQIVPSPAAYAYGLYGGTSLV